VTSAAILLALALAGGSPAEIDFATQIMPVLTKAGCNAGACHGAAAGRGGFRLSLLGGDAAADYDAIVHEFEGRRINLARPEASLLLKKPTGYLDHGGDVALDEDSAGAKLISSWIETGAPRGAGRKLKEFLVTPTEQVVETTPADVRLRATALFSDGTRHDVTPFTLFVSADSASIEIHASTAVATVKRRGQHVVIARFLDRVVPIQLTVPLGIEPVDLANSPRANFIDDEVLKTLATLRLPLSPPAGDATFLRRVRLDLTGRLPTPEEVAEYLQDTRADKRSRLIDRLLTSEDFADYWTLQFARQLRLHSLPGEVEGVKAYASWLREQLVLGTPLNVWAEQLLTATGDSHEVGPANFPRMVNDARAQAELVGDVFLGVRLGCANCHNHPLDRWTQDDYHGLAAVFSRLSRGRQVQLTSRGGVTNVRTGEPALPRIPGVSDLTADEDNRERVARWLTSRENERFARATVNRIWKALFGRGLVEPVDDMRDTNPATHPELLARLAEDFVDHNYDLRHTLRLIAVSETYARSSTIQPGNVGDDRFYSRAYHRPLGPEVLADAIADVTGVTNAFAKQPAGTRAVSIVDPLSPAPSLDILGRCSRAGGCEDRPTTGGLPAQLHLLNGDFINQKLTAPEGRLQKLIAAEVSPESIVREFYERGLGRKPTASEMDYWNGKLSAATLEKRRERCEDFVWSLLCSREFRENH
jgi:hypothetical protein